VPILPAMRSTTVVLPLLPAFAAPALAADRPLAGNRLGLRDDHITSFGEDARGEVYIVDYADGTPTTGEVYRIVPRN